MQNCDEQKYSHFPTLQSFSRAELPDHTLILKMKLPSLSAILAQI